MFFLINGGIVEQAMSCFKNRKKDELFYDIWVQIDMMLSWESIMLNGMTYLYYLFPIFMVIPFYSELKGHFKVGGNRFKNRKC